MMNKCICIIYAFCILPIAIFLCIEIQAYAGAYSIKRDGAWGSLIVDVPGQAAWVRINGTSNNGASFAFDFGQANTIPLLAIPAHAPAIQMAIAQIGMPRPGQPFTMHGSARVDLNRIIPVIYNCTLENGMAWMIVTGMPQDIISQCIHGKTLRLKVDTGAMSYFYNFSLNGFTASLRRAARLYQSQFGSLLPDASYF